MKPNNITFGYVPFALWRSFHRPVCRSWCCQGRCRHLQSYLHATRCTLSVIIQHSPFKMFNSASQWKQILISKWPSFDPWCELRVLLRVLGMTADENHSIAPKKVPTYVNKQSLPSVWSQLIQPEKITSVADFPWLELCLAFSSVGWHWLDNRSGIWSAENLAACFFHPPPD